VPQPRKRNSKPRALVRSRASSRFPGAIILTRYLMMYCPTGKKQERVGLLNAASREKLKAEIESGAPTGQEDEAGVSLNLS